jgi:hypothetical protein
MKLQKLSCLGFSGTEIEDSYWQELDRLVESREHVATEDELANDTDGLLVRLGAEVNKAVGDFIKSHGL